MVDTKKLSKAEFLGKLESAVLPCRTRRGREELGHFMDGDALITPEAEAIKHGIVSSDAEMLDNPVILAIEELSCVSGSITLHSLLLVESAWQHFDALQRAESVEEQP